MAEVILKFYEHINIKNFVSVSLTHKSESEQLLYLSINSNGETLVNILDIDTAVRFSRELKRNISIAKAIEKAKGL